MININFFIKLKLLLLLLLLISSCKNNHRIFVSQPASSDNEIHGYNLIAFFDNKNSIRKVKIKDKQLLSKEIRLIKDSLNKILVLPESGEKFGIYKYAFIISKDTLYSTSTFNGWRYQNRVGKYEVFPSLLKTQILKASKEE